MYFPWLRFIPFLPFRKNFLLAEKMQAELTNFCNQLIEEHKSFTEGDEPHDYIEAYFAEQARQKDNPNSTFTGKDSSQSCKDLINGCLPIYLCFVVSRFAGRLISQSVSQPDGQSANQLESQ